MRLGAPLVLVLALWLPGCHKQPKAGPTPGVTPVPGAAADAAPAAAASPCDAIAARFAATLAAAPGTCAADAECGCYNPVAPSAGCGGVTDRATAGKLQEIEADFHKARCPWWVQCAAWSCRPRCAAGRCAR